MLGKNPDSINIAEILRSAGECLIAVQCVSSESACERNSVCVSRFYWKELNNRIGSFLESVTLLDICEKARNGGINA